MFSYQGRQAYFRIVRRGGRWYVEYDGSVAGGFDDAQAAAEALAQGRVRFDGLAHGGPDVPADIGQWFRGDLERVGARRDPPARANGHCEPH